MNKMFTSSSYIMFGAQCTDFFWFYELLIYAVCSSAAVMSTSVEPKIATAIAIPTLCIQVLSKDMDYKDNTIKSTQNTFSFTECTIL